MSKCKNKLILLDHQLYEIELELLLLDDKIEDISTSGYNRYIKDICNSSYSLEYLLDKKVKLQEQRNKTILKIKLLRGDLHEHR